MASKTKTKKLVAPLVLEALDTKGLPPELADLARVMALNHALSEAYWECCSAAASARGEANEYDDFGPLGSLAMHFQSRSYDCDRMKRKVAIEVVDGFKGMPLPSDPAVVLAKSILTGKSDRHRVCASDPGNMSEEEHESLARAVAKLDE